MPYRYAEVWVLGQGHHWGRGHTGFTSISWAPCSAPDGDQPQVLLPGTVSSQSSVESHSYQQGMVLWGAQTLVEEGAQRRSLPWSVGEIILELGPKRQIEFALPAQDLEVNPDRGSGGRDVESWNTPHVTSLQGKYTEQVTGAWEGHPDISLYCQSVK